MLKKQNPIWNYFETIKEDWKTYTICNINGCKEKLIFSSSIYNMNRHLKTKHKLE